MYAYLPRLISPLISLVIANEMVHDRFSHLKSPLWLDSDASADETSPRLRESVSNTDLSQGLLGTDADSPQEEDKSSGVQRPSGVKSDKEKKKRTRVTPEQLIHLERYFAMDRNPTAARRKDISELLGMQERQTQIWFQNRFVYAPCISSSMFDILSYGSRAKAKLQDGKHNPQFMDSGLDGSPLSAFTAELHNFIHEDGRKYGICKQVPLLIYFLYSCDHNPVY